MPALVDYCRVFFKLKSLGSRVDLPYRNPRAAKNIQFGTNVVIRKHAWFTLKPQCQVSIGDNTRIGRHFAVSGVGSSITIANDVLISERVFITESHHDFEDISQPVQAHSVSAGPVSIGAETWIGIGVCIMPNVSIGKHCVIGANSTVTKDIPDYSIAAGSPAVVRKRYDFEQEAWVAV